MACFGEETCEMNQSFLYALHWFTNQGVQWLSGRVLYSRLRGRGFEPHQRHCVVVLEQDTFILAKYWRPIPEDPSLFN